MTRPCRGPRPERSTPPFAVPAGACDCHTHTFGPYARFPLAAERSYTPPENDAHAHLRHLDGLGFRRGVIVTASAYGTDNRSTLAALRLAPDRLRGVALLAEEVGERDLDELTEAGVRGVRVNLYRRGDHAYRGGTSLATLRALAPRLRARGWHAQIWIAADGLPEVADDLEALGLDLVFDHMGYADPVAGLATLGGRRLLGLLESGRGWCKISGADRNSREGPPYRDVRPIAEALIAANPARIVWGSDWPHVAYFDREVPDTGALLALLGEWATDEALRARILVDNPAALYGFGEAGGVGATPA